MDEEDTTQVTIYYNPTINKHKKTIAHARSIGEVLAIPFAEMPTAHNIWAFIYQKLDEKAADVFEKDWYASQHLDPKDFDSWYKLVTHNPDRIDSPIAVKDDKVVLCKRQTEVYHLMETAV
jgi:arsenate reductase-like glutaredoxin family protein